MSNLSEPGPARDVRPPLTRPPDFEEFWVRTREELGRVPLDVSREPLPAEHAPLLVERLKFGSLGGVRISGYLIRWDDGETRPLVVHGHGYGDHELDPRWDWARAGVHVLGVQVRGYGRSRDALPVSSPDGYVLTGIRAPEEYVLRGAVCDYARAVEAGAQVMGPRVSRLVLTGTSLAGGLAIMAEGMMRVADLLAVAVPTFGWAEGRRFLTKEGSGAEIKRYLETHPEREEDLMAVLSYFDTMNFAPDVRCPTLVGVGLVDDVVPAPTVYAIANRLGGPHEVVELPVSHSDLPEERLWDKFEDYWLRLAVEGVPPGFGKNELPHKEVSDAP